MRFTIVIKKVTIQTTYSVDDSISILATEWQHVPPAGANTIMDTHSSEYFQD